MAGRHVISVVLTGNNRDLNRALRSSSAEINRFAAQMRKTHGDVDGMGSALQRLKDREVIRVKTIEKVERFRKGLAGLRWQALAGVAALGGFNVVAAATVGLLSAASGLLVGGAGAGLVYAFGRLWLSTDKAKKAMQELGNYIRNDLMGNTMKGFYDLMDRLPNVLRRSFDGAKPQLRQLGKALEPLLKMIYKALPGLTKQLAGLLTTIAKSSKPFLQTILDGLPAVIKGIKQFFAAFKNDDNAAKNLSITLKTLGEWIGKIGGALAGIKTDDLKWALQTLEDVVTKVWNAFKGFMNFMKSADAQLNKVGLSVGDLAVSFVALSFAARGLGPIVSMVDRLWNFRNITKAEGQIKNLSQSQRDLSMAGKAATASLDDAAIAATNAGTAAASSGGLWSKLGGWFSKIGSKIGGLLKWIPKIAKIGGVVGIIVTALTFLYDIIQDINTQGTYLNKWWQELSNSPVFQWMKQGFEELKASITDSFNQIKTSWDDLYATLEETGVIDFLTQLYEYAKVAWSYLMTPMIIGFVATLGTMFRGLAGTIKVVSTVIKALIDGAKVGINVIKNAINAIKDVFNTVKEKIALAWEKVKEVFAKIGEKLQPLKESFDKFKNKVSESFNKVKESASRLWNKIQEVFGRFKAKIQPAIDAFTAFKNKVQSALSAAWNVVRTVVSNIYNAIKEKFEQVKSVVANILSSVVDTIKQFASSAWNAISGLAAQFYEAGVNIMQGLWNGLMSIASSILDWFTNFITTIMDSMTSLLGIFSPSRVFYGYGVNIVQGLANGLDASQSKAFNSIEHLGRGLISTWTTNLKAMDPALEQAEKNVRVYKDLMKDLKKGGVKDSEKEMFEKRERQYVKAWQALRNLKMEHKAATKFINQFTAAYDAYIERIKAATEAQNEWNIEKQGGTWLDKVKSKWSDLTSELGSYRDEFNALTGNLSRVDALRASVDRVRQAWEDASAALQTAKDNLKSWLEEIGPLTREQTLRNAYENAKSALADLQQQQQAFADSLASSVKSVLNLGDALDKSKSLKFGGDFLAALRDQSGQATEYAQAIRDLQKQGASKELIEEIQKAGIVDGMAIMQKLTTPGAIREANALVKDIMTTADALGQDMGAVFYDNQIHAAEESVKKATASLTLFYQNEVARSQVNADRAKARYVAALREAMRVVGVELTAATSSLDRYWANQVNSARSATQQLLAIWTDYAKKHRAIMEHYHIGTGPGGMGSSSRPANITNNVTYNIKGQSGKEIVREIQAYEKSSGASWRR